MHVHTHHSLTHPYHSTLSNDQSHCTVGVFWCAAVRENIFFPNISDMILFFCSSHPIQFIVVPLNNCYTLLGSVGSCTHMSKLRRHGEHNFSAYTGKRRKKNPKNHFLFPFTWRIFVIIPYFLRPSHSIVSPVSKYSSSFPFSMPYHPWSGEKLLIRRGVRNGAEGHICCFLCSSIELNFPGKSFLLLLSVFVHVYCRIELPPVVR